MAIKFCYGVKVDLSFVNVASIRCPNVVLKMTGEYCETNIICKTDLFLSQFVLNSMKESVCVMKSYERVMPQAEELEISLRCIDAVVSEHPRLINRCWGGRGMTRQLNPDISQISCSRME